MDDFQSSIHDRQDGHSPLSVGFGEVWAIFAWVLIIVVCALWISQDLVMEALLVDEPGVGEVATEVDAEGELESLVSMEDDILGKLLVGMNEILPSPSGLSIVEINASELRVGDSGQQLAWVVLQGWFKGPQEGLEALEKLIEENTDPPLLSSAPAYPEEAVQLLKASFAAAQDGTELDEDTREKLEGSLGYYGKLAIGLSEKSLRQELNRAAYQAAIGFAVVLLVFATVGFAGVVGLIIMIVLAFTHKMHGKVVGSPGHGVYAETFALWLIAFFGLQILAGMSGIEPALLMAALAFFLSLTVLAWPVLRGKRWSEVCSDIGWHKERSAIVQPMFGGLGTWAMALPLMGVGLLLTIILSLIVKEVTGSAPEPSHPIQQEAMSAGGWQILMLFLIASVAAPIVEETMFRGVLYTHLRGVTRRYKPWLSILLAIIVSSTIFAAIHPQGLVFMPPLMGLAAGFCIGREWRGSLIAPMVAHGLHNGLVMSLNVMLFM